VCSKVEHKEKLFVPNLNTLSKHIGKRKVKIARPRKFYFPKDSQHVKNESIVASIVREGI
jgi:hypothetical protein